MKKQQNLTGAGAILLLSSIIVKLIGALFKIPLSSDYALGDLGFGYFSAAYDVYLPLYNIALTGFPVAIAKVVADFTAQNKQQQAEKSFIISFKALLVLGLLGAFCLCALALPLATNSFYSLLVIAPAVVFCCISAVFRGYFEGHKNMTPVAVSSVLEALCKLCLGLSGAVIAMRLTNDAAIASAATMIGITIGSVLSALYLWLDFRKNDVFSEKIKFKGVWDTKLFKSISLLAIPVAVASLTVSFTSLIDAVTLRYSLADMIRNNPNAGAFLLRGTLYKEFDATQIPTLLYGIRGKAHTLFNLVPTLTATFGMGAVPIIAEAYALKDNESLKINSNLTLKLSAIITLPCAVGFFTLSRQITALLYGDNSAVLGGRLLGIYAFSALFAGLSIPLSSLLQGINRQKQALINIIIGLLLKLVLNLALTPVESINILGSAISTSLCFGVIFILNILSFRNSVGFSLDFFNSFLKPFGAAFICGITAFGTDFLIKGKLGTVVAIAVAGIVYIVFLWVFKAVKPQEVRDIFNKG